MERTFYFCKALSWTVAALLLASLLGCSSLEGKVYRYGDKGADGTLAGVPFTLNKPVPTVTHSVASDTGKEAYQVTFNYVADSEKRYTLQIKPSMLASVDFSMTFDAGGSLTEASAKSADQTGALIATVGKLAVLAAADSTSDDNDLLTSVYALGDEFASRRSDATAWRRVRAELQRLGSVQKIRSEYVYPTSAELTFLREFLFQLRKSAASGRLGGVSMLPNPGAATFANEREKFKTENPAGGDIDFAKDILDAFSDGDIKKLKDRRAEQIAALEAQRAMLATNKTADAKGRVANTLRRINLLRAALKGIPIEVALVADLAEMSLAEWQKRSVLPVAKDIEAGQQLLRVAEASQQPADVLAGLRSKLAELMFKKAAVLGVLPEYQRRQALTERLAIETTAKDLKALREERDALDVAIAAAEPARQKAKTAVADGASVAVYMTERSGEGLGDIEIIQRLGEDRPRYVIVVKSLEPATLQKPIPKQQPNGVGVLTSPAAPPVAPLTGQPGKPVDPAKEK